MRINCPVCKVGKLYKCQNATLMAPIRVISTKDIYMPHSERITANQKPKCHPGNETWIECSECHATINWQMASQGSPDALLDEFCKENGIYNVMR